MKYDATFDDSMMIRSQLIEDKGQCPAYHGELWEETCDDFGNPILKKINDNTVVIGGAITALEHITGITDCWKPSTLNAIYNLNNDIPTNDLNTKVALFGVGSGGAALDFGNIYAPDPKQRDIPGPLPFRFNTAIKGLDADKYFFKIPDDDGVTFRWMLKEFEGPITIKSMWKDSTEEGVDGTEIVSEIYDSERTELLQTFAECHLKVDTTDVHEYYTNLGELNLARYNCIGLYTGTKVELDDGSYDYVNVRLFSYVTFNNKDVSTKTLSLYRYRIFSMI